MVATQDITSLIDTFQGLYDSTKEDKLKNCYSKYALLELCGWIEITFDSIVDNCCVSKLKVNNNIDYLRKDIIKRTYGFEYRKKFRPMLMKTIGLINIELLENEISSDLEILESQLNTLYNIRNPAAHTTIIGVTTTYETPSRIKGYLDTIHPILKKLESKLIDVLS